MVELLDKYQACEEVIIVKVDLANCKTLDHQHWHEVAISLQILRVSVVPRSDQKLLTCQSSQCQYFHSFLADALFGEGMSDSHRTDRVHRCLSGGESLLE